MIRSVLLSFALIFASATQVSCAAPEPQSRPYGNTPTGAPVSAYTPSERSGIYKVEVRQGNWSERRRTGQRDVPWKAYLPEARAGQAPVIIFSHGLGGSRDGSESMGRHLASHGYAVFHIQHAGTDRAAFQRLGAEGIMASLRDDPQIILDRFRDVPFALDEVTKLSRSELRGRIDPARAGISGHSFGAITTLTIAGQRAQRRIIGQRFADPRFTAALAMSPNKPAQGSAQEAFADMKMPIFHMTGTKDGSPVNPNMSPSDRLIPFATINNVGQHLLLLNGGTHFTFADVDEFQSRSLAYPGLDRHKALIRAGSLAYWDAYLKGNASAKSWLVNGGYARYAGDQARVDYKPARR